MTSKKQIGKIIRVEWDDETEEMRVVMEITDPTFKKRVLHSKDFQDVLVFEGKNVMVIASKSNKRGPKNAPV